MAVEYAPQGLIGVLTPQANTTVEPEFWIMLPPGVALINARMTSDKSSLEARLVDYFDQMDRAVDNLPAVFYRLPVQHRPPAKCLSVEKRLVICFGFRFKNRKLD